MNALGEQVAQIVKIATLLNILRDAQHGIHACSFGFHFIAGGGAIGFLQGRGVCQILVPASTPVPFCVTVWKTTFHAVYHCIFNKLTSITKEVIWIVFFSVRSKGQACDFATSCTLVELMMSSHSSSFIVSGGVRIQHVSRVRRILRFPKIAHVEPTWESVHCPIIFRVEVLCYTYNRLRQYRFLLGHRALCHSTPYKEQHSAR